MRDGLAGSEVGIIFASLHELQIWSLGQKVGGITRYKWSLLEQRLKEQVREAFNLFWEMKQPFRLVFDRPLSWPWQLPAPLFRTEETGRACLLLAKSFPRCGHLFVNRCVIGKPGVSAYAPLWDT